MPFASYGLNANHVGKYFQRVGSNLSGHYCKLTANLICGVDELDMNKIQLKLEVKWAYNLNKAFKYHEIEVEHLIEVDPGGWSDLTDAI